MSYQDATAPDPRDVEWSMEYVKLHDGRLLMKVSRENDDERWGEFTDPERATFVPMFEGIMPGMSDV